MTEETTETSLYEELQKVYRLQNVPPHGEILVIPSRNFKRKWEKRLNAEGVKVLMNSHNGRSCFFLHKAEQKSPVPDQTQDMADPSPTPEKVIDPPGEEQQSVADADAETRTAENHPVTENIRANPKQVHRKWTEPELQNLRKLHSEGKRISQIARVLGRPVSSVQSRVDLIKAAETHDTTGSKVATSPTPKNIRPIENSRQIVRQHLESSLLLLNSNKVKSVVLLLREACSLLLEVEQE
jgi:hypothetical protein